MIMMLTTMCPSPYNIVHVVTGQCQRPCSKSSQWTHADDVHILAKYWSLLFLLGLSCWLYETFCFLSFWLCTGDSANDWLIIVLFPCWYLPVVRWQHKYALCKWSANYLDLYYLLAVMKKSYWLAIRLNWPPNCTCKAVYKETSWKKCWHRIYTLRILLPTQIQ